jgi:hypothetical protein
MGVRKMATEQRLIDANALIEEMKDCAITRQDLYCNGYAQTFIENAPTVDAVEVVRCKKCAHCTVTSDGMVCERALPTKRMEDYYIYGSTVLARVAPDDFCSHGERRTNHV